MRYTFVVIMNNGDHFYHNSSWFSYGEVDSFIESIMKEPLAKFITFEEKLVTVNTSNISSFNIDDVNVIRKERNNRLDMIKYKDAIAALTTYND